MGFPAATIERERLEAIAYFALWQLRDIEPGAEPAHFRTVRLDLHRRVDGDGGSLSQSTTGSAGGARARRHRRRHLRLVPTSSPPSIETKVVPASLRAEPHEEES